MSATRKILLFLTIGIIAVVTVLFMKLSENPPSSAAAPATRIVVAKKDLTVGSFVQGVQDLDYAAPPPIPALPDGTPDPAAAATAKDTYLYESSVKLTDFNGAVVRRAVHTGEPVTQNALMKSGEGGFMSAVLEAGMRAVSIGVNATSGNAGFVSPGDHVDLIVTHRVKNQMTGGNSEETVVSETFIHNVRIVAVDQQIDNPENKAILAKTVTVEVTPLQAEQVAVAAEMGKISLALRSLAPDTTKQEAKDGPLSGTVAVTAAEPAAAEPKDEKKEALEQLYGATPQAQNARRHALVPFTRDSDLSQLLGHKSATTPRVQVIHGDKTENLDFYQDQK